MQNSTIGTDCVDIGSARTRYTGHRKQRVGGHAHRFWAEAELGSVLGDLVDAPRGADGEDRRGLPAAQPVVCTGSTKQ